MNRRSLLIGAAPALILPPAAAHAAANMPLPRLADPQQRIEAAMNDIRAALTEIYPGFNVTSGVSLREGLGGLALGAHPLNGYQVRHFFCDDPVGWSPLRAGAMSDCRNLEGSLGRDGAQGK